MVPSNVIIETYHFESEIHPEEAARHLCQEQSTAQWKRMGKEEDFRLKHGAKVVDLKILEVKDKPFYPSSFHRGPKFYSCEVKIAHPHINFGPKLPNLLTVVCGEGAYYVPGITSIKLMDLEFPKEYLEQFEGPTFGVQGVRKTLDVYDRPVFLGVVKPNIGLAPSDFAELAYQSWLGGLDAPKDDETLADTVYSPLIERTKILGKLRHRAEKETGEKKMFIANITDEIENIEGHYDTAVANGMNAVMLNAWPVGLSMGRWLAKKGKVPLVAHFDFIAAFSRSPFFGMSITVAVKLQRLAGFDMILFPGMSRRMRTSEEEVLANVKACLEPWGNIKPALPVPGGSDWAGSLAPLYEKLGTVDFGMVPGRGVFSHPSGPAAGAKSFRQAWEALRQKIPIEEYAKTRSELREAIETFGEKK